MRLLLLAAACAALLSACTSTPAPVPRVAVTEAVVDHGSIEGAPYRIDVPADWNGELVVLMHGYEPVGTPRTQPWPRNEAAPVFLAQGYAVAASAYSSQGWAVAEALPDSERLRRHFVQKFGTPEKTWAVGFSMGGHIALAAIEQDGTAFDGALSFCGVNLPAAEAFEMVLTPLVAVDAVFPNALPLGPSGLFDPQSPPMLDPAAIEAVLATDEQRAGLLARRLDIARTDLAGAVMLRYLVLRELAARAGGIPVDNRTTAYTGFGDDAAFNRAVRRYTGDPVAMAYAAAHAPLHGRIDRRVVLLSNVADPTVPAAAGGRYAQIVEAEGRAKHLVVLPPVGRGHCDFGGDDLAAAMQALAR